MRLDRNDIIVPFRIFGRSQLGVRERTGVSTRPHTVIDEGVCEKVHGNLETLADRSTARQNNRRRTRADYSLDSATDGFPRSAAPTDSAMCGQQARSTALSHRVANAPQDVREWWHRQSSRASILLGGRKRCLREFDDGTLSRVVADCLSRAVRDTRDLWHTILARTEMTSRQWSLQPLL